MKYKIAIVDSDNIYLSRISKVFGGEYADKIDLFSYSSLENFDNSKEKNRFDMVLFGEGIIKAEEIPQNMPAAFLVSENDIDKVDGVIAICKYQKYEIVMRQILEFCLERENARYTKKNVAGNTSKVVYVTSAIGGTGVTTIAIALAKYLAQKDKKVMYLSLEKNPATNVFLTSNEETCFSDIIYMIKSKKSNLMSRIENIVQKDESGVYFIPPCRTVFDINELKVEDLNPLLQEVCSMGSYDYIIIDGLMEFNNYGYFLCDYADYVLAVSNGNAIGEQKLLQFQNALEIWDQEKNSRLISKTNVIYNRFSNKTGIQSPDLEIKIVGGAPKFEGAGERQICDAISGMDIFEQFI